MEKKTWYRTLLLYFKPSPFVLTIFFHLSVLENTRIRARSVVGMAVVFPWAVGMVLYGGMGYLLKNWRHTTLALILAHFFLLVCIWYESCW